MSNSPTHEEFWAGQSDAAVDRFYKELREHIQHEDNLCNQRMTWLILIETFLLTVYGFSLGAEVIAADHNHHDLLSAIYNSRKILSGLGIATPIIIFAAFLAAILSISKLVGRWYELPEARRRLHPQIIGNARRNKSGMLLGQAPLLVLPAACVIVWATLVFDRESQLIIVLTGALTVFSIVLVGLGIWIGRYSRRE